MDPWLEHPGLWLGVHNSLIAAIRDDLASKVAPKYFVDIDQHTYITSAAGDLAVIRPDVLVGRTASRRRIPRPAQGVIAVAEPDVEVAAMDVLVPVEIQVDEWYLEVRTVAKNKLVTVIEVLSPTNKSAGAERRKYLRKRHQIFKTGTSLVEIDLLRGGRPMPLASEQPVESAYRILVSRGATRPQAKLYAFGVRLPIPPIPIPLLPKDPEPSLDLGAVLHALYERARFDLRLDYTKPPVPPLGEENAAWARGILAGRAEAR
jgi:hypothetical protein